MARLLVLGLVLAAAWYATQGGVLGGDDGTGGAADDGRDLRIAAASSLREVVPGVFPKARIDTGGTGSLRRRIEQGTPFDLFLAANEADPAALARAGRCERPVTFASNRLTLAVPRGNPAGIRSLRDLGRDPGRLRLAIGAPGVPVGDAARAALRSAGLIDVLDRATVTEEADVAGVVGKVALGTVDAGIVYVTDVPTARDRIRAVTIPSDVQPAVTYAACVLVGDGARPEAARAALSRLLGLTGRTALLDAGFDVPDRR